MLYIISGESKEFRHKQRTAIYDQQSTSEVIVLDEAVMDFATIEQYVYPSLFSVEVPVVLVKFLLGGKHDITPDGIKKIIASPTVFVFEDFVLPATTLAPFKKHGAIIFQEEKQNKKQEGRFVQTNKSAVAGADIFYVTNALTASNKKDRWIIFQQAHEHHAVEALLGIMYWKLRDLIQKEKDATRKNNWLQLYTSIITAHATAWQKGIPLDCAIEKVLLL